MRASLGGLLVQAGVASEKDVKELIKEGERAGERLGELVIRRGLATDELVGKLLAEQWQLPYAEANDIEIDEVAALRLSAHDVRKLGAKPIRYDGNTLVLAIAAPGPDLFDRVAQKIGEASYVVVSRSTLEWLVGGILPSDSKPGPPVENGRKNDWDARGAEDEVDHRAGSEAEAGTSQAAEPAPVAVSGDSIETVLASIDQALEASKSSGEILARVLPLVRRQLAEQHAALAAAEEARERDSRTIREIKSELSGQSTRLQALWEQTAALAATFDADE